MNIQKNTNTIRNKCSTKKNMFLLYLTATFFLVLTSSMTGIYNNPTELVFAQEDIINSENLWSENLNVTSGQVIPGQQIITFPNGSMPESDISALADSAENSGIQVIDVIPEAGIIIANITEGEIAQLADFAESNNALVTTEPSRIVTIDSQTLPTGIDRIDAEPLTHSSSTDGSNTSNTVNATIGILDTGIDLDHPDLNVIENISFVDWSPTGNDIRGHGTHVAGIVAAKDNGIGVVGVAPGAKLIAIKVLNDLGWGTTPDILQGLRYVLENPEKFDVINLSLGQLGVSNAMNSIISEVVKAGVPVVVSSGNNNLSATYHSPASAEDAITVSASYDGDGKCGGVGPSYERQGETIRDDSFAPYSNHGDKVDIMAPGTLINSTIPNGDYARFSGTSMAAPHVAGAIALYKSQFPDATPSQIEDLINNGALYVPDACNMDDNNGKGYISDRTRDNDAAEEPHLYVGKLQ